MKIAIIGTRGIPNHYGGFEQFVSEIAPMLVKKGHRVYVYNPSSHPLKSNHWKGVEIIKKYDGKGLGKTVGQFLYDLLCIINTRKLKPDIILQLGYTSSSIWSFLFPKQSFIATNMDGIEWKRGKYNKLSKIFLRYAERLAVNKSHILIADSLAVKKYLEKKFNKHSLYIAYGARVFNDPDPTAPINYGLTPGDYDLMITRFVPENHIEMVINGFILGHANRQLVIIGADNSAYAKKIVKNYHHPQIIFKESFYDIHVLNSLRFYSNLYFHGHSVGGTNPSLLEAMSCRCLIVAHNNIYNREVLGGNAYYFNNASDISFLLGMKPAKKEATAFLEQNIQRIKKRYNWNNIVKQIDENILNGRKDYFDHHSDIYHEHRI